jgi:hypothetical protein
MMNKTIKMFVQVSGFKWTTWIMKYYHMDEINQLMIFENMDEKNNR